MATHLHQVTFHDLLLLSTYAKLHSKVSHTHSNEVALEVRIEVCPSLLERLPKLISPSLRRDLARAIDDRLPYVYVT